MGEYLNPANLLTSSTLACGFLALILATEGELGWAAAAVGTAAGLDILDGVAARPLAGDGGGFGANLHSEDVPLVVELRDGGPGVMVRRSRA